MRRWVLAGAVIVAAAVIMLAAVVFVWVSAQPGARPSDSPEAVARRFYGLVASGNRVAAAGLTVDRWEFLSGLVIDRLGDGDYWTGLRDLKVGKSQPSSPPSGIPASKFVAVRELSVQFTSPRQTATHDAGATEFDFVILVQRYPGAAWQILGQPGDGP